MANKIIKYNLTSGGTIPTYIADGGYYPKANSNSSPQDYDMIGATVDGSSETGLGELADKAAIKTYLDSYTSDWKDTDSDGNEVDFDQDKLCSKLLSLVSRENRYAASVLELMKIKQRFYENAYNTISAELPNLEGMLQETTMRPIFGEDLDDHLKASNRKIAKPIALSIMSLLDGGLTDEGLFRIPTKQIKLDKVKSFMDTNTPLKHVLQVKYFTI